MSDTFKNATVFSSTHWTIFYAQTFYVSNEHKIQILQQNDLLQNLHVHRQKILRPVK